MAIDHGGWQPDWGVPPGDSLQEILDDRGITQADLARRMDRPLKTINEIVKGKAAITPDTAIQLERALAIPATYWNNLERNYREYVARSNAQEELSKYADWVARFPIATMRTHNLLPRRATKEQLADALLSYFQINSPAAWSRYWVESHAALRQSAAFAQSAESTSAWLRWGQIVASKLRLPKTDLDGFSDALEMVRTLTRSELFAAHPRLDEICAESGIALLVLPEFPRARVSGATQWLPAGSAIIQLSGRFKTADQFWMSFFHEAWHLLNDRRGDRLTLDFVHDTTAATAGLDEREARAERFARETLVPQLGIETLVASELTQDAIRTAAERLGVGSDIVLGRLQRAGLVSWSAFPHMHKRFQWPAQRSLSDE
jgi:HTH-type transcriptional regulator/antitoxin HigA